MTATTPTMPTLLRQTELAHYARVSQTSARKAFMGKLIPALNDSKTHVFSAHPLVRAYIASTHGLRKRRLPTAAALITQPAPTPPPVITAEDPFKVAMANAQQPATIAPPPAFNVSALRKTRTDAVLFDLHTNTAGQLPADVDDLGAMTLREVVDIFGGLQALADAVKALKHFADMKVREVDAAKKRGDLVDRRLLTGVLVPLIELAFKRLVGEVPTALTERLVARTISGGVDMKNDVEEMLRDDIGGVLESLRDSVVIELTKIDDDAHT